MKLGGEYEFDRVLSKQWERFADEVGFSRSLVKRRDRNLAELVISKVSAAKDMRHVEGEIAMLIRSRCERTMRRVGNTS